MAGVVKARIEGDSSGFRASVNSAMRSVNEFKSMAESVAPSLAGMFSIAGMAAFVGKQAEAGAEIYNMSQRLGVSAQSIQILSAVAKEGGTSVEQLAKSMLKMSANIQFGGIEADKYQQALSALGLATKDLQNKTLSEQLEVFADAFVKTGSRAEATAAIVAIFGEQAYGLLPILAQGKQGLQEMAEHAVPIPDEDIASLKRFETQLQAVWNVVKAFSMNVGLVFANTFKAVAWGANDAVDRLVWLKDTMTGMTFDQATAKMRKSMEETAKHFGLPSTLSDDSRGTGQESDGTGKGSKTSAIKKDPRLAELKQAQSEINQLSELEFRNKLKTMTAQEKIAALKEKEAELTKSITEAEQAGINQRDAGYLKAKIEREKLRGEVIDLQKKQDEENNKPENQSHERFGGTQIYSAPIQLVGAMSSAVFAQSSSSPAFQTNQHLSTANKKLDQVVDNTKKTAAALTTG